LLAGAVDSPLYDFAPQWLHCPLIVLATIAIVIASQSIISGAYSLAWQAVQLSFWPRMNIVIYVPLVNWALAAELALAPQTR
jgi:KUP system potassium uptake protein